MSETLSRSPERPSIVSARLLWLILAVVWVTPEAITGQSSGYTVTAHLNPVFIHPQTGQDLTGGRPLQPITGLFRGADGWMWGMSAAGGVDQSYTSWAVLRVSPTTGIATVVIVFELENSSSFFWIVPGDDGRLYFTVREQAGTLYAAPGFRGPESCPYGCVMVIDTLTHGLDVYYHFGSDDAGREGHYPDMLHGEDNEGALYVDTSGHNDCADLEGEGEGALVKIPKDAEDGTAIVLEGYGCDEPPFDWSTVSGGEDVWQFSNGLSYWWHLQNGLYSLIERDPTSPGSAVTLATLSPSLGYPAPRLFIDDELGEGSGYIYAMTCCGGKLGGGVVLRVRVPSLASPDLVITGFGDAPAAVSPSVAFNVTDTISNDGPEPAAQSITRYFLSLTGDERDIRVGNRYIPELAANQESTDSAKLKIPTDTPYGTYKLVACADATLLVAESDDTNNCRISDTAIVVSRPDLVVSSIGATPELVQPNAAFIVTDAVSNLGGVASVSSTTRYYLSPDRAKSGGDLLLSGARAVESLAPSGQSQGSRTVGVPSGAPAGAYYLLACADDALKVKELNEANNCRSSDSQVHVGRADLLTTFVSDPPGAVAPGYKFTVSDIAFNQGQVETVSTLTRYYLSADAFKTPGDVLLAGARTVPTLAPGQQSAGNATVSVPAVTPAGAYRVIACADDKNKLPELNETNNCMASTGVTQVRHPDLVQLAVSSDGASVPIGGSFNITDTVANNGAIATFTTTTTRYYLSMDRLRDSTDVLLQGGRSVPPLEHGASNTGSRVVTVPSMLKGAYYLFACADDGKKAIENNESNNCLVSTTVMVVQ